MFKHTVKIIRASGTVTKRFSGYDYEKGQYAPHGQVDAFIRKAIAMPKTVRVEVEEEDTQLYGYPVDQRHYPRAVILKDGRAFNFYGLHGNAAYLHDGPLRTFHIA